MSYYYDVAGSIYIDNEVWKKEKEGILEPLMNWHPEILGIKDGYQVKEDDQGRVEIKFDHDEINPNSYNKIGFYLKDCLKQLKMKYPKQVSGTVLYVVWHEMRAVKLDLNEENMEVSNTL